MLFGLLNSRGKKNKKSEFRKILDTEFLNRTENFTDQRRKPAHTPKHILDFLAIVDTKEVDDEDSLDMKDSHEWFGKHHEITTADGEKGYRGVGIYVKNEISELVEKNTTIPNTPEDVLWITIMTLEGQKFVAIVYSRPNHITEHEQIMKQLQENVIYIRDKWGSNTEVVIVGDLNARMLDTGDHDENDYRGPLQGLLQATELDFLRSSQKVPYTCYSSDGRSINDYFIVDPEICNLQETQQTMWVHENISAGSDHRLLTSKLKLKMRVKKNMWGANPRSEAPKMTRKEKKEYRKITSQHEGLEKLATEMSEYNRKGIKENVQARESREIKVTTFIERGLAMLHKAAADIKKPHRHSAHTQKRRAPIKKEIVEKIENRSKLETELAKTKQTQNRKQLWKEIAKLSGRIKSLTEKDRQDTEGWWWLALAQSMEEMSTKSEEYSTMIKKLRQKGKAEFPSAFIDEATGREYKTKEEILKHVIKYYVNVATQEDKDGKVHQSSQTKPERERRNRFKQAMHIVVQKEKTIDQLAEGNNPQSYNRDIEEKEVDKGLAALKGGTAPDEDNNTAELFKYAGKAAKAMLLNLFKIMWKQGITPRCLKKAIMVLIHKKGSKRNIKNYRPITLINQLLKAWEKILDFRLEEHMLNIGSPARTQGVGRKHRGATDAVKKVMKLYEGKKKALMAVIDYSKAYDRCERETMTAIMIKRGIKGRLLAGILSTYEDCKLKVRIQGTKSYEFTIPEGLKQGSVLSPRLFILYIDQLLLELEASKTGMTNHNPESKSTLKTPGAAFMDDLILSPKNTSELSIQMKILRQFTIDYGCVINMDKGITLLHHGLKKETEKWMADNPQLKCKIEKHTTYLGVDISLWASPYKWNKHIERRCKKARGTAWALKRKGVNSKDLGIITSLKLYESHIIPVMLYGTEVTEMTEKNYETLDKCQQTILGSILGFRWCTPTRWALTESGSLPAKIRTDIRKIGDWFKQVKENEKKTKITDNPETIDQTQNVYMKRRLEEWGIESWLKDKAVSPSKKAFKKEIMNRSKTQAERWLQTQHSKRTEQPTLMMNERFSPCSRLIASLKPDLQSALIDARANTMGYSNDERGSKTSWAGTRCDCWEAKEDTLEHAIRCSDTTESQKILLKTAIDIWPEETKQEWKNTTSEKKQLQILLTINEKEPREKARITAVAKFMKTVQTRAELKWKAHVDKRIISTGSSIYKKRKKK